MNWIELKALHHLNEFGETTLNQTLNDSFTIRFLTDSLEVLEKTAKKLIALDGYSATYQTKYAPLFERYQKFLSQHNLLRPQTRHELADIDVLMKIAAGMESGDLNELREQIIAADESLRGVSLMFFKNEKYLLDKQSLIDALKQILRVEHFSLEKDQQYMYRLECHNPTVIVLCENLDFLTKPNKPRQFGIELWYAGGKNIQKLQYGTTRGLPIYYSCDWDYDGLCIFAMVKALIQDIILLMPNGTARDIVKTDHHSHWKDQSKPERLSGLSEELFTSRQQSLLKKIIAENKWIVEESNNLVAMLEQAGFVFKASVL